MVKNKIIYTILSFIISIALIWYLLSHIEIEDLFKIFSQIYYPFLLIFIIISLIAAYLRALRYKWLLGQHHITWGNIFLATFIRNLFVDLFPARIGSLSYVYVLNRRMDFPFEIATSTFVLSFLLDFLTLSPFVIFSIFLVGIGSIALPGFSLIIFAFMLFILLLIIFWKLVPISYLILKVYQFLLKIFKLEDKKWAKISINKILLTIDDLILIKKRKIFWHVFSISFGMRLAKYGSLYFLLFSLLHSYGFSLENLSFWKTTLGITGAEFTSILPVKGIGGFGTWEAGWALSFKLMDFDPNLAILSGISVHLITNIFEYSLGIFSILILAFLSNKKIKRPRN